MLYSKLLETPRLNFQLYQKQYSMTFTWMTSLCLLMTSKKPSLQRNIRQLLLKGSFILTKWCSNDITFCWKLPEELLAKPLDKLFHHKNTERFLGFNWSPFEDSIGIQIPKFDCLEKNSLISKIFDPFGLISTFTFTMKIQLTKNFVRCGINHWKKQQNTP